MEHPPVQLLPPEHLLPFLTPFRGVSGAMCGGAPLSSPGRPNLSRASSGSDHSPSHTCVPLLLLLLLPRSSSLLPKLRLEQSSTAPSYAQSGPLGPLPSAICNGVPARAAAGLPG